MDYQPCCAGELESLPRIGKDLAEKILSARPFNDLEDLKTVQGIDEEEYLQILPYVRLEKMEAIPEEETHFPPLIEEEILPEPEQKKEKEYFCGWTDNPIRFQ